VSRFAIIPRYAYRLFLPNHDGVLVICFVPPLVHVPIYLGQQYRVVRKVFGVTDATVSIAGRGEFFATYRDQPVVFRF